jgi:hypothetical protein
MGVKRPLLIATTIIGISLSGAAGANLVSAATITTPHKGLAQDIADTFKLNTADVQKVIDQHKLDHQTSRQAKRIDHLKQAVIDKKITQAQADYITNAQAEIGAIAGNTEPKNLTTAQRGAIKTKTQALKVWAKDNKIPRNLLHGGKHHALDGNKKTESATN